MSQLTFFPMDADLPEPRHGAPLPQRLVEGAPKFRTWDLAKNADGTVTAGIWDVTPGAYRSIKGATWEFCSIVSGVSELIEDGHPPRRITAGDSFVMHPGFEGTWKVIETTRKLWVSKD